MIGWIIFLSVIGFLAYIRLAPSDPVRWNQPITATENADLAFGAVRIREAGPDALAKIDTAMKSLPRTTVLAGSVPEGRVTYVTRSKIFGFPDYTTAQIDGETLKLFARLRFGKSDVGVNRARLEQVLIEAQP